MGFSWISMMASCKTRFPSTTRSIVSFFPTRNETVDSVMEENKTKDNDSDEEVTDRSQKPNSSRCETEKFIKYSVVEQLQLAETWQWVGMLCELCIRSGRQSPFTKFYYGSHIHHFMHISCQMNCFNYIAEWNDVNCGNTNEISIWPSQWIAI